MTQPNFNLLDMPGVETRIYCSLNCGKESTGTIIVEAAGVEGGSLELPICEECVSQLALTKDIERLDTSTEV